MSIDLKKIEAQDLLGLRDLLKELNIRVMEMLEADDLSLSVRLPTNDDVPWIKLLNMLKAEHIFEKFKELSEFMEQDHITIRIWNVDYENTYQLLFLVEQEWLRRAANSKNEISDAKNTEIQPVDKGSKLRLTWDKSQNRFKYGDKSWSHKYGIGEVLKLLARYPQYEYPDGKCKKGSSVTMERLLAAFKEGDKKRIKGIGLASKKSAITERSVRDVIHDIRKTANKYITKENERVGIKQTRELFEIRPLGGEFLLVFKK